jgi:hypothetical protein
MSKTVFRNYDKKAIKSLLKEIGKTRFEVALEDAGMTKPLSMDGFFVEYETETQDFNLYYEYPSKTVFYLLPVLGFWSVPTDNWIRERKE